MNAFPCQHRCDPPELPSAHGAVPARAGARSYPARGRLGWVALAVLATASVVGCGQGKGPARETKPPEVVVTTPITDDEVMDYQDYTGRLEAVKAVDLRARVTGYVLETPFKDGDAVRKGDVLFRIDDQQYKADFDLAEANLKLARADRNLQQRNLERARRLLGTAAVAQEEYDQITAALERATANIEAALATRERAKLYLEYTRVTSPLDGRISRRHVDPGNLVNADQTLLTTIVTEDPVYAYFDVDERTYLDLLDSTGQGPAAVAQSSGDTAQHPNLAAWFTGLKFPVMMRLSNEDEFVQAGEVDFVDNRVSATTGTVRVRGIFKNPRKVLKAGLFVRIRLPIGAPYRALLIPDDALMSDQGRKYVFVVNDKDEVAYRSVTLGHTLGGLRVVKKGLEPTDRVLVSGMQRVRPGAKVSVQTQDPPKKPTSPLAHLFHRQPGAPGPRSATLTP